MQRLKHKVALVMGAGSAGPGWGNGKACAVQFAREGASVACFDLQPDAAEETAAIIRDEGGQAIAIAGNAAVSADVAAAVQACLKAFGRIDVLHNNVGIVINGGVVELPEEDWDRVFDVNLKSCYLAMKHAIPPMVAQGGGAIVNVSSISSLRYLGTPYASYYTTKAAMNHLTRVTAAEYASRQVRVNAILPGLMDTPMAKLSALKNHGVKPEELDDKWRERVSRIPMGWMGDAWDVAKAAVFLASEESRFITGVSLTVDGGMTLSS
ncbi:SDR family NAD(P)-dependent oxidoreductase [Brucella haematophila]|uniref:SDR family oxidoreductase n=1 Tax=Brucella haematophila TaxID=419474 RepID=A0ABX1DPQ3_9HYPH|nr:SDR family oxidoreductase [Brucella haematophila]NKC04926.1 SDR family oxidoreductase [Brucella haematophila]TMV04549.1 SDR family oxidoreductase [Brucella haematophila]